MSAQHPSREEKLAHARSVLAAAGRGGATIREVTPAMGGLRIRVVEVLVGLGEAEWIVPGKVARLIRRGE